MAASNIEPGYYEKSFVLTNISGSPLSKDWTIYYSQLPRYVKQEENPAVKVEAVNDEYYNMVIGSGRIKISAATPHGIFNGMQTLLAMLKNKTAPYQLNAMSVENCPDLLYRGQMIDIARNFITVENLRVIPEIELPGHVRTAIVSMKARYK